jgi:hypothetical protein
MPSKLCWPAAMALLVMLALGGTALAQPQLMATLEIESKGAANTPVCVPLSLPKGFAEFTNVLVHAEKGNLAEEVAGQLTLPGLATEHIQPSAKELVRRDLHFMAPQQAGTWRIRVVSASSPAKFAWKDQKGEYAELSWSGTPVLRYVYKAYDKSTPDARDKTYKVFHHLYDPEGKRFVTNGGNTNDPLPKDIKKDLLYPHHRGLMYAFNKITYGGNKPCDTWHAKPGDTHEEHAGFLSSEAGSVLGRHRVAVNWHGEKNDVFAKEERELTVYKIGKGTLVEFVSRLKTVGPPVKLDGDPQHAGFQFRAHNDVAATKSEGKTYYLRPDGKGGFGKKAERNWDPKTGQGPVDLGWDALCFELDAKRYTVVYMDQPKNPHPSRWSERDYGRIGCYFEYDLTEKAPLVVDYRVWLQPGEMAHNEATALSEAFVAPPKVTVK